MPSSSARCAQLPRATDKLPFYIALRKLRDHLCGDLVNLDDSEVTFHDLDLKVEPKSERLDAGLKLETADPEIKDLTPKPRTASGKFQVTVEVKTEDDYVAGKQRKVRRKACTVAESGGKEIVTRATVANSAETVVCSSPYFLPWQQTSVYPTLSVGPGICTSASAKDTTDQLKHEVPYDFAQYGCMPEDLSSSRTNGSVLPLTDVKPRFLWPPTNF